MKNKMLKLILTSVFCLIAFFANSQEQFNFDVTEIEITENGNKFKGKKEEKLFLMMGLL